MRIGVFIVETSADKTSVDEVVANAAAAEAAGFATAWVPHIPWSLDAFTTLTLAAGATQRIELASAVYAYTMLSDAANEGVRYAIVHSGGGGGNGAGIATTTYRLPATVPTVRQAHPDVDRAFKSAKNVDLPHARRTLNFCLDDFVGDLGHLSVRTRDRSWAMRARGGAPP